MPDTEITTNKANKILAKVKKAHAPEIAEKLLKLTTTWYSKYQPPTPLSQKAQVIRSSLLEGAGSSFSYSEAALLGKMFGTVLGENIELSDDVVKYKQGVVIVPLSNDNSHTYKLNEPCICYTGDMFLRQDGGIGNHMSSKLSAFRPATKDEIVTFLSEIQSNPKLDYILEAVLK